MTILDHLNAALIELIKPVARVGHLVGLDAEKSTVLDNGVLELLFLLGGIGVVETQEQSALVLLVCKVVVEKGCLGVTNVQVTSVQQSAKSHSETCFKLTMAQAETW